MRSRPRVQRDLFSAQGLLMGDLKEGTIYRFLLDHGDVLFPDRLFDSFYSPKMGRPAVPPSILMKSLILKQYERLSDEQTVERATWDGRWVAVNDTQIGRQPFAKSTLQLFRAKCILDKQVRRFLEQTVRLAEAKGLKLSRQIRVALDTTHIVGAAAIRDTYDLLADAIRVGLRWLKRLNPQARKAWLSSGRWTECLGGRKARYLGKSLKGAVRIDWDNADERDLLLQVVLEDLSALLAALRRERRHMGRGAKKARKLDELLALFEEVAGQDVEPKEGGGVRIAHGTAPDRKPSVHDPEMRHGRKSSAGKFTGYKAAVAVDVDTGLVTEAFAMRANQADGDSAVDLVEGSEHTAGRKVEEAIGDTAFGATPVRKALEQRGVRVTAKAPPASHRKELSKDHFQVDPDGQWVRCPAGHVVRRRAKQTHEEGDHKRPESIHFEFPVKLCRACRDRPRCTDAVKRGRTIRVGPDEALLQRARREQKTATFQHRYRLRLQAEWAIRRAKRYGGAKTVFFGQQKTDFHWCMANVVGNLIVLLAFLSRPEPDPSTAAPAMAASFLLLVYFSFIWPELLLHHLVQPFDPRQKSASWRPKATFRPVP